ncbi:hypothetical protein SAMN04487895_12738 [Paenibacillus sophorae]|uniref:Phage transcriptional regulator, ArpU family n=1 Tax=Paenibacillus sophorae TaxID=1333845 RepID=A0A1H8VU71_9BACL|nr:hypothetical protein SAMN04487895_12738 [Paenibacillus sophorae]
MAEWEEGALFPVASKAEIARTKALLQEYRKMRIVMDEYENHRKEMEQVAIDGEVARRIDQDELHADKTANAVLLAEKQRWVYGQYQLRATALTRAHSLILDDDVKKATKYRFFEGYSMKETCLFFGYDEKDSTIKRRVREGITVIANNMKLLGFFDKDGEKF